MKCPIDGTPLVMADRAGVEIDYCPQCRGVWLDRGELDKIIERSGAQAPAASPQQHRQQQYHQPQQHHHHQSPGYTMPGYERKAYKDSYKYKKKKSFLDEIFDF